VLLCPTSAFTPPPHVDHDTIIQIVGDDHRNVTRLTHHTRYWYLAGTPALSLPWGFDGEGLPLAVQLVTRIGSDEALLSIAARLEAQAPDRGRRPAIEAVPPSRSSGDDFDWARTRE
jgi:Asp-tRNA(Asn)/Glu-tRNA(Gln) amidotransferase A subunit family amidase